MSIGMTLAVAPLTSTVLAAVEKHQTGMASGLNSAVARLGGLIAVALSAQCWWAAARPCSLLPPPWR